jgi:ketosteroid isomerase-like protein
MSEENVEAIRRLMAAYNRRDIDAFLQAYDPAVEARPLTLAMFGQEATVYRGHEGIRQFIQDVDEALTDVHVEVVEVRDLGERVVATGRIQARGRASRAEIETPVSWLVEFRDGRVLRIRDYLDRDEALKAAGASD